VTVYALTHGVQVTIMHVWGHIYQYGSSSFNWSTFRGNNHISAN